jgi:hypothetical protein
VLGSGWHHCLNTFFCCFLFSWGSHCYLFPSWPRTYDLLASTSGVAEVTALYYHCLLLCPFCGQLCHVIFFFSCQSVLKYSVYCYQNQIISAISLCGPHSIFLLKLSRTIELTYVSTLFHAIVFTSLGDFNYPFEYIFNSNQFSCQQLVTILLYAVSSALHVRDPASLWC